MPMVLPLMAPLMAQSVLPLSRSGNICDKPARTGVAPKALTKSAWVADDTRTRRPALATLN